MKLVSRCRGVVPWVLATVLVAASAPTARAQAPADSTDRALLAVVEATLEAGVGTPAVWPGYDAASRPLIVYRPGHWQVLLNPPAGHPSEGWTAYPSSWPPLSRPAWFDADGDPSLVGQLGFDTEAPGGLVAAIPLYEDLGPQYGNPVAVLFSFVVHESFHQFQRHRFADVNTPSEERYPTLDPENNALAAVEFLALRDAVEALGRGDAETARDRAQMAVAVHVERMGHLDDDAREIERCLEVVEGTAKYVETRYVAGFAALCAAARAPKDAGVCPAFAGLDAPKWLADDFERRLTDGAIAPADMARNRLYPVAAAVALLLDTYAPEWKVAVERDGTTRGLFDRLDAAFDFPEAEATTLVDQARNRYGWDALLASSRARVREYLDRFDEAESTFDALAGIRLVVGVPTSGVTRSRSSREERYVVDAGRRTLGRFVVYTLRRSDPALELSLHDVMVLDETDDNGRRTVTAHIPHPLSITVDGEPVPDGYTGTRDFHEISLKADGVTLHALQDGVLAVGDGEVRVELR